MRIGMVLDAAFPPDQRVEKEAVSLINAGHEVFLFTLNFVSIQPQNEIYKGIQIRRYPAGWLIYKFSALAYTLPFYCWLVTPLIKNFLISNNIEVIHIHDMVIAQAAFNANKEVNLPVVLDLHENRPEIMRDYKHVKSFIGKVLINLNTWKKLYYSLSSRADFVIVVADLAKEDVLQNSNKPGENIIVVPNTISKAEFLNYPLVNSIKDKMEKSYNLLYIGDTSLRRGTEDAIHAVHLLRDSIPNLKLWIVGRSSADPELLWLTAKLGLEDHVVFEGWKDVELLPSYIQYCNVALSPLKRNKHHDTTYANKIFQYMALGKPVVVSDCTTQAQLVTDENCGEVYVAGNILNFSKAIKKMYDNPTLAGQLGVNGKRAVIERWHWERTVSDMLFLYDKIAQTVVSENVKSAS